MAEKTWQLTASDRIAAGQESQIVRPRPAIGDRIMVRGIECRIFKVHAFGTVDAEAVDGSRAWRVTGLGFL